MLVSCFLIPRPEPKYLTLYNPAAMPVPIAIDWKAAGSLLIKSRVTFLPLRAVYIPVRSQLGWIEVVTGRYVLQRDVGLPRKYEKNVSRTCQTALLPHVRATSPSTPRFPQPERSSKLPPRLFAGKDAEHVRNCEATADIVLCTKVPFAATTA